MLQQIMIVTASGLVVFSHDTGLAESIDRPRMLGSVIRTLLEVARLHIGLHVSHILYEGCSVHVAADPISKLCGTIILRPSAAEVTSPEVQTLAGDVLARTITQAFIEQYGHVAASQFVHATSAFSGFVTQLPTIVELAAKQISAHSMQASGLQHMALLADCPGRTSGTKMALVPGLACHAEAENEAANSSSTDPGMPAAAAGRRTGPGASQLSSGAHGRQATLDPAKPSSSPTPGAGSAAARARGWGSPARAPITSPELIARVPPPAARSRSGSSSAWSCSSSGSDEEGATGKHGRTAAFTLPPDSPWPTTTTTTSELSAQQVNHLRHFLESAEVALALCGDQVHSVRSSAVQVMPTPASTPPEPVLRQKSAPVKALLGSPSTLQYKPSLDKDQQFIPARTAKLTGSQALGAWCAAAFGWLGGTRLQPVQRAPARVAHTGPLMVSVGPGFVAGSSELYEASLGSEAPSAAPSPSVASRLSASIRQPLERAARAPKPAGPVRSVPESVIEKDSPMDVLPSPIPRAVQADTDALAATLLRTDAAVQLLYQIGADVRGRLSTPDISPGSALLRAFGAGE